MQNISVHNSDMRVLNNTAHLPHRPLHNSNMAKGAGIRQVRNSTGMGARPCTGMGARLFRSRPWGNSVGLHPAPLLVPLPLVEHLLLSPLLTLKLQYCGLKGLHIRAQGGFSDI